MKTLVRIAAVLAAAAAMALIGLSMGCATVPKVGDGKPEPVTKGAAKAALTAGAIAAPEYAAILKRIQSQIDSYGETQKAVSQDKIISDDKIVVAVETPDGKRWPVNEVKVIARGEDAWTMDKVPSSVFRAMYGPDAPVTVAADLSADEADDALAAAIAEREAKLAEAKAAKQKGNLQGRIAALEALLGVDP